MATLTQTGADECRSAWRRAPAGPIGRTRTSSARFPALSSCSTAPASREPSRLCFHGVAWYTHRLGGALLGHLSRDDGRDLAAILATAIGEIAAEHGDTCDIADPSSPQATVAMVRAHQGRLDWLLLADSFLVLDRGRRRPAGGHR